MLIAEYGFIDAGWRWKYELYPDRLILIGLRGDERQQFEMELKHASPMPDSWLEEYGYRCPRWLLLSAGAACVLTLLPCCGVFCAADGLGRNMIPVMWVPNVLTGTFFALAIEAFGTSLIPRIFGIRHFRRLVRYKRRSDGGEITRFGSALNPTGEAFEKFVRQVSIAIAALRPDPEPPPSHAFKIM